MRPYVLLTGCLLLFFAAICDQITLATNRYEGILSVAIALSFSAAGCFLAVWKGTSSKALRIVVAILLAACVMIVLDAIGRLSYSPFFR